VTGDLPDSALVRRSDGVVFERMDEETLILDPEAGRYVRLNATGGLLWAVLERPTGVAALADRLVEEHGLEHARALRDVRAFVEDLRARGLVSADATG
jgi:hypothetical protein